MSILNLPNRITTLRIALIPLFAFFLLSSFSYGKWYAAGIFLLLSATDFFDGYFARKHHQVTDAGKILDPIADKLLITTALILLMGKGVIWWMAATIIFREVILTAIRLSLIHRDLVIAASPLGKIKTISQIVAIIVVIVHPGPLGQWLMAWAVAITIISGIDYLITIRRLTGAEIVNIANTITLSRLLLLIPFFFSLKSGDVPLALLCFTLIVVFDLLDGMFARLSKKQTTFGKVFDSSTDSIVLFFALISETYFSFVPFPSFIIMLTLLILFISVKAINLLLRKDYSPTWMGKLSVGLGYLLSFLYLISFAFVHYVFLLSVACISTALISYFLYVFSPRTKNGGTDP